MTTLNQAHSEWASRPADERFSNLGDLHASCVRRSRNSQDGRLSMKDVTFAVNGAVIMTGTAGNKATLTHWALGQVCSRLGVPRDLLPKLDPSTAGAVLNDRLPKSLAEGDVQGRQRALLLKDETGGLTLRAMHGDVYDRVWDSQVTSILSEYLPQGWRNPVAYEGGKWGAKLTPQGLYAGDRDMFAFLIDGGDWAPGQPNVGSFDVDGEQFNRGFFVWNSEVGSKKFGWMSFMFDVICGNHYVWGASDVQQVSAVHRGKAASKALYGFRRFLTELNEQTLDAQGFRNAVRVAKKEIAVAVLKDRTETLDLAFTKFKGKFTQTHIADALVAMLREEKNVTGTRYDWLAGFTAVARTLPNADDRFKLEKDASDLLLVTK